MWNLVFLFAGLFLIILIEIVFLSKKTINKVENRIFKILMTTNLLGYISEITLQFSVRFHGTDEFLSYFLAKLYVIYIIVWIGIFSIYTFLITRKQVKGQTDNDYSSSNKYKIMKYIHIVIISIAVIVVLFLPIEIFYENNLMYSYGGAIDFLRIYLMVLMGIWVVKLLFNFKLLKQKKYVPVFVVVVMMIGNVILQAYDPTVLIATFIMTYTCYALFHSIENPDLQMVEELKLAMKIADRANSAKSDFLSSVSHEIRTPLNTIIGFTSGLLKSPNMSAEEKEQLNDVVGSSKILLRIMKNILDMGHLETETPEINNAEYNVKELILKVGQTFLYELKEKGLEYKVHIAPDIPIGLYGDSEKVYTIIENLLSNAVKFTDKGSVDFKVECVKQEGVCRLLVTVADTGRGIKEEHIDKLFRQFEKLEETNTKTLGSGLGLAIVKKLVDGIGGTITPNSEYGVGSRFIFTLDQKITKDVPIGELNHLINLQESVSEVSEEPHEAIDLTNKRILVVDDNKMNIKVARRLLIQNYNAKDASVDSVESGQECIDKHKSGEVYDLILMDYMMPGMDGIVTFKKLKLLGGFNTPTIMLTADAVAGAREKYLKEGFIDYVPKPILTKDMDISLNKVFGDTTEDSSSNGFLTQEKETPEDAINFPAISEDFYTIGRVPNDEKPTVQVVEDAIKVSSPSNVNSIEYLKRNGVDVATGLELLDGIDNYNEMMLDFYKELTNKISDLELLKTANDMPNYAIKVHSLKSDAKYLGLTALAELAFNHELKSKENDYNYITSNYEMLVNEVNRINTITKEYFGI